MKRKLALLMAFMMAATLVPAQPADAATKNVMNKTVTATSSGTLDTATGVILSMSEDGTTIKGAKPGDYFELHLTGDAVWTYDSKAYTNRHRWDIDDKALYPSELVANPNTLDGTLISGLKNVTVKKLTNSILGVKVNNASDIPAADLNASGRVKEIAVPMLVFFNGTPDGSQKVTIVPKDSEVSATEYTFSNVASDAIKFRVAKKVKISRSANTKAQLIFDEITPDAFNPGEPINLKLPTGFAWDTSATNYDVTNATIKYAKDKDGKDDTRILEVTPSGVTGKLDSIYLNIVIIPDRDAQYGDVDVIVQKNSEVSPTNLVVAEYVDYGVQVKAEKVLNVIAGKDIEGLYKAKLTIEEPATSSLQGNRYMEFRFVDENGKDVNASLQNQETLKLTKKSGDPTVDFKIDFSSISAVSKKTGKGMSYGVSTSRDVKADTFDLYVQKQSERASAKYELEVPFVVASNFEGKLFLKVKGAGAAEQLVQIADVKPPVTFEVKGALPQVKIGLQKQPGQDIAIKETEAAALQDYIRGTSSSYAEYNLELEEKFAKFKSVKHTVEGDLKVKKVEDDNGFIRVQIDRRSTKASTITLSGITATLDRTVPYGEIRVKGNFGAVKANHDLTNNVKTFDYFTTITPVSDEKRITTVFKIGEKAYTEVVRGVKEEKTADVAPFIKNDRTMLPLRYVANAIGAVVNYDPVTRIATFQKFQSVVTLNIDKDMMYVNGSPVKLDSKPVNVEGRVFLPLANIAQAFGLKHGENIIWNADNKTVTILPQDATKEEIEAAKAG